jgi:S1-C subfamily serine protease
VASVRAALLGLVCAALGAAAALGIGRAAGVLGSSTTVLVRESAPDAATRGAAAGRVTVASPVVGSGTFSPARIFADRSPGVVTIFTYTSGQEAQGSGFVVSTGGTILTNAHVITNAGEAAPGTPVKAAAQVYVEFADHDRVPATIVGWDVFDDVGVIHVDPAAHALDVVPLGRSADVVVGQPVAAIGSPLGNVDSLAVGVVSAVGRSIAALTVPNFQLVDAIQIDAPIAHGSSGGPLLDAVGHAIGINAQIRSDSGGASGIGFAVPIDAARRSLDELAAGHKVGYAYAGLQSEDLTPSLARHLGLTVDRGALVDRVTPGGPAALAGLRGGTSQFQFQGVQVVGGGDVITAVNGAAVANADDRVRIITNTLRPGQTAVFTVERAGHARSVAIRLASRSSTQVP